MKRYKVVLKINKFLDKRYEEMCNIIMKALNISKEDLLLRKEEWIEDIEPITTYEIIMSLAFEEYEALKKNNFNIREV